jgi:predicted ATPase/class 3 adenylate cyclase
MLSFGPYRPDLAGARLWRGKQEVRLTGKTFAVLRHLATHAGELVTKDELFQAVWPETVVSEAALTSCIKELRQVLRDQAQERRYIETVHRRGFRFIGQLRDLEGQTKTPTEMVHRQSADGAREVERKLVAILSADVHGYSRLMGEDEVGTLRTLTAYRAVTDACIRHRRGRVVNTAGDSVLAEFASAVDAVQCAVEIQQALAAKNADLPSERQMAFRIGINVGDVVVEGEQLYGEGVNIAARLEGLAEAGGLCISGTVYDQIKNKVALAYEYLGERMVKNIAEPVRVYRVQWESEGRAAPSPTTATQPAASSQYLVVNRQKAAARSQHRTTRLVGREADLTQLAEYWEKALRGDRQVVFVAGEPGIGKTTLVDAFLQQVAAEDDLWLGRGQCIEHYGAGEAYLPLLEALGRLGRESGGQRLIELLSQHAPTWLVQMPALLTAPELEMLQRKTQGATRERMLRELAEAVERLTAERPLVLWLEDLHWGDVSTLDWLAYVARRREPARLLVLGTYRPVDVLVQGHPLRAVKQELQTRGYCAELLLDFLNEEEVAEYLRRQFPLVPASQTGEYPSRDRQGAERQTETEIETESRKDRPLAHARGSEEEAAMRGLARVVHRRTDGNPLFMINVVNDLVARGVLVQNDGRWELQGRVEEVEGRVPESLQQLIAQHIERLPTEAQRLLEVASVAGAEFSAAAVAAGVETEVDGIEEQCEALVRREHFLRASGTADWPDGTIAARYGFIHALYQEVLYRRLTARRRQRLHQRIGEREEAAYGKRAGERAAELAVHFEQGRDYRRAIQYLHQAGENAVRRSAYQEALSLLTKGLELLKTLPDTSERAQQELTLQLALSAPLTATRGYAAPALERACTRALELCRQLGETPQLLPVLMPLSSLYISQGKLQTARELAEQSLTLAQMAHDRTFLQRAHNMLGNVLFFMGELAPAREHLEQGITLYDSLQHHFMTSPRGLDPGVACLSRAADALFRLGYPDQALQRIRAALTLAHKLSHPFSLAYALTLATAVHQHRREVDAVQECAEAMIALSREHGFASPLAEGTIMRGWTLAEQGRAEEGIAQMRQGLAAMLETGVEMSQPFYLAPIANAYGRLGQIEEGLAVLTEALAIEHKNWTQVHDGELYRLKGTLTLQSQVPSLKSQVESEAEECFQKAIEIARRQQAKSLELRTVMNLARLWQEQGKKEEARQMLAEIYGWFTEGFDTKDLQEAKALLKELT